MRTVVSCGLILGAIQAAWLFVVMMIGDYTNIWLGMWVVLLMEFVGLVWALRRTAKQGRGYWRQVLAGTLIFMIVGGVLFGATYIAWTVIEPDYADRFVEAARRTAPRGVVISVS